VDLATKLEAAIDTRKMAEALSDFAFCDLKLAGNGHGSGGIEDVVAAGDVKLEWTKRALRGVNLEAGETGLTRRGLSCLNDFETKVGLGGNSVGKDAAAGAG
jgi:hypothetical protein